MPIQTRKPTGKPSWPILLIAGVEKSGKTYNAALASASELVGRTLWIGVGEDDPDEYGAIPGARFEIVVHDGSYRGILAALQAAAAEPAEGKPNLLVLDSATRLWELLSDEAQATANRRAASKAAKYGKPVPDEDVPISMDLWNVAKQRWAHAMDVLRNHQGPSVITARLDSVVIVDGDGKPTKDREWKVKAEKSLPYDVGAIVELHGVQDAYLRGVRSLRFKPEKGDRTPYADFSVEKFWRDLGLEGETGDRTHSRIDSSGTAEAEAQAELRRIAAWVQEQGIDRAEAVQRFAEQYDGANLRDETDLERLREFLSAWQAEVEQQRAAA